MQTSNLIRAPKWAGLVFFLLPLFPLSTSFAAEHSDLSERNVRGHNVTDTITVTGHGEVSAEPDQALVTVSVSTTDKNVNQAKSDTDKKYESVLAAARSQGIASVDIKTLGLDVQPEYQWRDNSQVLMGTRVSRTIMLTVKDIERVAALLQALVEGGVSNINGVKTGFKDRADLERKALTAAIADAKNKAQFMAAQFDKKLGAAHTVSEHNQQSPVYRPYASEAMMSKSVAADVPAEHFGTQSVKASVNVVFHAY